MAPSSLATPPDSSSLPSPRTIWARTEALCANPFLAYLVVVIVQLRVIWNVWRYKDLVFGDTSSYFLDAVSWTHGLHDDIIWSPLYTDVWGSIYALMRGNPYSSEMVLRVAVVMAAAVLVLAIMRSLVSPAIALAVAVWWTLVPANFNVLYEVHLFSVLPILIAALIVARTPTRRALGIALAILVGTTLLLRNEVVITTVLFACAVAVKEMRQRRQQPVSLVVYGSAFVIPIVASCALVGALYWRSFDQGHSAALSFSAKQKLSFDQAYAFNYQQRYPSRFKDNAFTEYQPLLRQVFGKPEPTLQQALFADPRAVGGFVLWNLRLLPSGLQVALFGATSNGYQPDYIPVSTHENYALVLSIAFLIVLIAGAYSIYRDPLYWRRKWLSQHVWIVILLAAESITSLFVVLIEQRPRPEYMYGLTVTLLAVCAVCVTALLRRLRITEYASAFILLAVLALVIWLPPYYTKSPRPLYNAVNHLQSARSVLQQPGSVLISANYNFELCAYLAATYSHHCSSPSWYALQAQLTEGKPIEVVLTQAKATAIYAEPILLASPAIDRLVLEPQRYGWRQIAAGSGEGGPWHVLVRIS